MDSMHLNFRSHTELQEYRRLVKKWNVFIRRKNQYKFLQCCLDEKVLPKTYGRICNTAFNGDAFSEYQQRFLEDRIQEAKWEVEVAHMDFRQQTCLTRESLQSEVFEGAKRLAGEVVRLRGVAHFSKLKRKLHVLCDNSPWSKVGENCNIINLANICLDKHQKEILGLGLNFSIGTLKENFIKGLSSVNFFNFKHEDMQVNFLKGIFAQNIENKIQVLPLRHRQALDSLAKNKNIKIMKADKGGSVVVMKLDDYLSKAYQLLGDENTYTKLHMLPSVTEVQLQFNRQVRRIANSIDDVGSRQIVLDKISNKIPSLPYFYGIPKAHKPGCPLRPIVATCNSPQSVLAQYLANHLSPLLGVFSEAHLLHSGDFIEKLRNLGNVEGKMISLDVTALFTNVPLEYVLSKLKEKHEDGIINFPLPIDSFLDLIRLCVSSTVFSFNGEGFKQKFGVAMGSPLFPILANLCMEFLETEILENCPPSIKPLMWVRYVDDIFLIYNGNEDQFQEFFHYVNNFLPSIQFTVEKEVDNKLSFLDVLVHHDPFNYNFHFSVFRKPTNAENYIHFFSFHSPQIKTNIIVNFVIRAYRICDPHFLDDEMCHIRRLFSRLCYPEHFIEKAISKARRKFYNLSIPNTRTNNNKFLSVPYHPKLEGIKNKLFISSDSKTDLVFNYNNTIGKRVMHNNMENNKKRDVGVYEIPCGDCNSSYFGETGRGLDIRLKEHLRAYNMMQNNSILVKHSWEKDHKINWEGAKLIFGSGSVGERRVVEGALISLSNSMEGNKSFTQEDDFINYLVCTSALKNFKLNKSHIATPDAAALSPAQVTELRVASPVAGAYADDEDSLNHQFHQLPPRRRSRRIAGLPPGDGVT